MAESSINSKRLQQIYEGARCSAVELRFLVERLLVLERAFGLLADDRAVGDSAEQFALHLLRGEGLVRGRDQRSAGPGLPVATLWANAKGRIANAGSRLTGMFAS